MLDSTLSRATAALLIAASIGLAGCGSSEKTEDKKPQTVAADKAADPPASKPAPKAQTAEASTTAEEPQPAPIVIKGSKKPKKDDGAAAAGTSQPDDAERQARIEELRRRAAASQGQDNGTPLEAPDPAQPQTAKKSGRTKAVIDAEIAGIDAQLVQLDNERKTLVTTENSRRGMREVSSDPERTKAIDQQMADLKLQKANDIAELAQLKVTAEQPKDQGSGGK